MAYAAALCQRTGQKELGDVVGSFDMTWHLAADTIEELEPDAILEDAGVPLPRLGEVYVESDGSTQRPVPAKQMSVGNLQQTVDSPLQGDLDSKPWFRQVEIKFEIDSETPDGESSQDPTDWCPTIDSSPLEIPLGTDRLPFIGIFENAAPATLEAVTNSCVNMPKLGVGAVGNERPLQTTAGEPYAPVEVGESAREFIFRFNRDSFDYNDVAPFEDTLNSVQFTLAIDCALMFSWTAAPHTAWLKEVNPRIAAATITTVGGGTTTKKYWEIEYRYGYKPNGWYLDLANKGHRRCMFSDANSTPDGWGGEHGYASVGAVPDGMPLDHSIIDQVGNAANRPVWLDKRGLPARNNERYYMRYAERQLADHTDTDLGFVNWVTA